MQKHSCKTKMITQLFHDAFDVNKDKSYTKYKTCNDITFLIKLTHMHSVYIHIHTYIPMSNFFYKKILIEKKCL